MAAATLGRSIAASALAALVLACTSDGTSPHPELATAWREYSALPAERALAIAGDLRRGPWVSAASGGHATAEEAENDALAQCRVRRAARRMQAACVIYAVGKEIVWRGR